MYVICNQPPPKVKVTTLEYLRYYRAASEGISVVLTICLLFINVGIGS